MQGMAQTAAIVYPVNPGDECIKAALEPGDGDLLYCILINEDPYEHFFTDNEEDYLAELEKYNRVYN